MGNNNEPVTFAVIDGKMTDMTERDVITWERISSENAFINNLTGVIVEGGGRVFDKYGIYIGCSYDLVSAIAVQQVRRSDGGR